MASGSFYKSFSTYNYKLIIEWSSTPTESTNSSVVSATIKLYCPYALYVGARTGNTVSINGASYKYDSIKISTDNGGTFTLGTVKSGPIEHNGDGTKSISISCSYQLNATIDGTYYSTITASNTIALDNIPRSSAITSAGNIVLGNKCSIVFTPASASFYYNIKFSIGDWYANTGLFCPGQTSAYTYNSYTISGTTSANNTTIYDQLPSSVSGTMTATLTTYSSNSESTQIGSVNSKTFTVTIPDNVVPTVGSIVLTPQTYSNLIQGKNKLKIAVSDCKAGTGSSIKSYTFSGEGISSTTTSTSVISNNNITFSGTSDKSLIYTVTVTDNRGRTASKTASITCYAYNTPSFNSFTAYRSDSNGTKNDNGTCVKCSFGISFSSVNGSNDATVKIYYKKGTDQSYSSTTVLTDSTNTSGSSILNSISSEFTYIVYATITDNYSGSISSNPITIFGASRTFNINASGKGIAFGKMSEKEKLECVWDAEFSGTAIFDSDVTFNGDVNGLPEYKLPTASTSTLGGVKVDGSTVTINNGVISSKQYSLPTASTSTLGGVKVDGSSIAINNGVISAAQQSSISAILNSPSGTSISHSFTPSNYGLIILGLTPSSTGAVIFTTIPAVLASSGVTFQVADESAYCKWTLSSTGISRASGAGYVRYIYGLKL